MIDLHLHSTASDGLLAPAALVARAAAAGITILSVTDHDTTAGLDEARSSKGTWWAASGPDLNGRAIAYFSAEFALHQSLPIYAGGLGVLAGDHCKEASDLGVPLIGVGFMYPQGYFHQKVSADGWQQEAYEKLDWADTPIEPAIGVDGKPCVTAVPLGNRTVLVAVWRVRAGRVKLYLLDTDLAMNGPADRQLTARLYTSDQEVRIAQEMLLGIGGVRALRHLGYNPTVWHMNEGHSAFATIEYTRLRMEATGANFWAAAQEVAQSTVFTTHTPVDAGHDRFPPELVDEHLEPLRRRQVVDVARVHVHRRPEPEPGGALDVVLEAVPVDRPGRGEREEHRRHPRDAAAGLEEVEGGVDAADDTRAVSFEIP